MCHHRIAAGLLQLSVLRHAKHELPEVTESAECCCTNCLPSSTTPTSLSRAKDLHWLPVRGRVDYKIAVLCYKAVKLQQPSYGLLSSYRQSRVLRSSTSDTISTQSSSTNMAARRFSCCAPDVWNSLPYLYALLTVSLVLGLSSRLTCSQDICSRSAVRASDTLKPVFRA